MRSRLKLDQADAKGGACRGRDPRADHGLDALLFYGAVWSFDQAYIRRRLSDSIPLHVFGSDPSEH